MRDLELGEMVTLDTSIRASNAQVPGLQLFIVVEKKEIMGRSVEPNAYPYYYIFSSSTGRLGPFLRSELEEVTLPVAQENQTHQ